MDIAIHELTADNLADVNRVDSSFMIDSRLKLFLQDDEIAYRIESIPPYTKTYPDDPVDYRQFIGSPEKAVFLAYVDGKMAGQVVLRKHWNKYAFIDWIVVDAGCRKKGVGRALMERAIRWAKDKGCPGLALETQDTNVAACQFYASCGFKPGGFDRLLYHNIAEVAHETAIYWYLLFLSEPSPRSPFRRPLGGFGERVG